MILKTAFFKTNFSYKEQSHKNHLKQNIKESDIKHFIIHITEEYKPYVYGVGLFVCGVIIGLSAIFFTYDETDLSVDSLAVEESNSNDEPADTEVLASMVDNTAEDETLVLNSTALEPAEIIEDTFNKEIRIKRNQGLMDALIEDGAERIDAFNAIKALGDLFDVRKIQVGQKIATLYSPDGELNKMEIQKDFDHLIVVNKFPDGTYKGAIQELPTQTITRHASGMIDDSLFLAAQRQGLPQVVIVDLIRIFSYDVDFQREIRKGDQFEIFYERTLSEDGRRVKEGDILFAKLTLSGKPISLYRYKPEGKDFADYFHEDGQSSKRALMKTPIEGARLSSYYGSRKHPVLGYTRMHKGVDFSAPTGTPIMAAGDGVVERASWYGSFGNYVRIRHNGTYKTIYAHMSKYGRGIKKGVRVKQGQIIGYVGATGRVTGRHLHYEVYMNGTQVNPLSLKIPSGIKLEGEQFNEYKIAMDNTNNMINETKSHILLTRVVEDSTPNID